MTPLHSHETQADGTSHPRWVGIAANAASGRGRGRSRVLRLVRALQAHGLDSKVAWNPEGRSTLVKQARQDSMAHCLVACGGDGTVSALLNERPSKPLTVLPSGTENLFASHFGIKGPPEELASIIASGSHASIDLGQIGQRRFALMAGIGFDAEVVTRHHKSRLGASGQMRPTSRAAYVGPVLLSSWKYRFPAITVKVQDPGSQETLSGSSVFLFNLPQYALGLPFAPVARGDDGWLDLVVFRNPGPWNALRYLWMVFRGIHLSRKGVWHRRVRRVVIDTEEPAPIQLDGDPGGVILPGSATDSWTAFVVPQAVDVLVPDSGSARLRAIA